MLDFKFVRIGEAIYQKSLQAISTIVSDIEGISLERESNLAKAPSTKQPSQQIIFQSPARKLMRRKKSLLQELQTIDRELLKINHNLNYSHSRMKNQNTEGSEEDFERATRLVAKMNKQRHDMNERKKRKSQQIQMQVQKSIQRLEEMNKEKELKKQQKRKEIENKIATRKDKLKSLKDYNRKADQLVGQLNNYRISLPYINSQKSVGNGDKKDPPQILSLKRHRKSPFLQKLELEERRKKQQSVLKEHEKRRLRQKHQLYGRKKQNFHNDSNLFVT